MEGRQRCLNPAMMPMTGIFRDPHSLLFPSVRSVCRTTSTKPSYRPEKQGMRLTVAGANSEEPLELIDDTCLVDDTSSQMGFVDAVAQNLESTKEDPEAMLGLLIPADEDVRKLCSSFNVDHCGLFLACRDAGDMTGQSEEGGYSVMQRFPSAIVAKSLTKQYKRPVGIEIVKMERGDSKLELFLVQSGLSTDELAHECSTRSHLALMPRTSDASALTTFVDIMVRAKLIFVGSGINHHEQAKTPEGRDVQGMTVLYFQTPESWSGFGNLELCVPGVHPELLELATEKFKGADYDA